MYGYYSKVHFGTAKGFQDAIIIFDGDSTIPAMVIPETVGQYTGQKDKDGKEIYEGDILKENCPRGNIYIVRQVAGGFAINTFQDQDPNFWESTADRQTSGYIQENCTVVGNIHDNPELLKESTDGKD